MPTKVRIVSPKGRSLVVSGRTDFATIKEKGRELLVASDICNDDNDDHDGDDDRNSGVPRRPGSFSDEAMQRARAERASYDVQFSLCSSRELRNGAAEGDERLVKLSVDWLPPRRGDGERDEA